MLTLVTHPVISKQYHNFFLLLFLTIILGLFYAPRKNRIVQLPASRQNLRYEIGTCRANHVAVELVVDISADDLSQQYDKIRNC